MERFDVAIVGAGHAGAQAAIMLRQLKFDGSIALIGAEAEFPYERPPLSKEYLAGDKQWERMLIRPESFWTERGVTLLPGRTIAVVDSDRRELGCADGSLLRYGRLVWAAGGRARKLSCAGSDMVGVHSVRCRADVDRMRSELEDVHTVVVIGGGYIGLEAAAVLIKLGKRVIVLEALGRVLARVAGEALSRFYEAEHRAQGVEVRLGARVERIEGGDRVAGVRLSDGSLLACEMIVVGIGIEPVVEPLIAAGAAGADGVDVDAECRTSLLNVFAVGDCAAQINRFASAARVRIESVANAHEQANGAARAIVGQPAPTHAAPWFWSNQYDLKLQTVGLSLGHDAAVLRGDPASRSFAVVYLHDGRVTALDCVNATRDYAQGRRLVEAGAVIAPARLADTSLPLKEMS